MYPTDERSAQPLETPATLADRLKSDTTGALRDALIRQLHAAEDQVHASLDGAKAAGETEQLKGLLDAVHLSERSIVSAWAAFHDPAAQRPLVRKA